MTKDIQLFDYQEDMVKRVQEAFSHHDSVMVQMPTGTGKTMVLANIVFSFLEKSNHPIWIVAHRRELVEQIKDTLNKSLLIFSKTHPSSLTLKGGSTAFPKGGVSKRRILFFYKQSPDFHKPGLCHVQKILYL